MKRVFKVKSLNFLIFSKFSVSSGEGGPASRPPGHSSNTPLNFEVEQKTMIPMEIYSIFKAHTFYAFP